MAGQEVFRWAVTALAPVAADAVRLAGLTLADIDVFVPHQANMRITDALVRAIGLRPDVVVAREIASAGTRPRPRSAGDGTVLALRPGARRAAGAADRLRLRLLYAAQVVRLP